MFEFGHMIPFFLSQERQNQRIWLEVEVRGISTRWLLRLLLASALVHSLRPGGVTVQYVYIDTWVLPPLVNYACYE